VAIRSADLQMPNRPYHTSVCPTHGPVYATANTPNHILHLLLTLVTFGVWLVVWIALTVMPKSYRCPQCGQRLGII